MHATTAIVVQVMIMRRLLHIALCSNCSYRNILLIQYYCKCNSHHDASAMMHVMMPQAWRAGIDVGALEQDLAAALALQELGSQLVQKEAALARYVCNPSSIASSVKSQALFGSFC